MKYTLKKYLLLTLSVLFFIGIYTVNGWSKYQYGNIILDTSKDKMSKEKVDLVIFPHWVHSLWFKCKLCHDEPFEMKKGATKITMQEINKGEKCGICHNGTHAFSQKECKRCHSLNSKDAALTLKTDRKTKMLYPSIFTRKLTKGKEKADKNLIFLDPKTVPVSEYRKIAERLNIEWDEGYFSNGDLPKDRLKMIDFEKILLKDKAVTPLNSVDNNKKEDKIRENVIIFEVLSDFVDSVAFKHKEHSYLIDCGTCHEKVFKSELGGNNVHMKRNANGEFCGYCHSKVSFPLAECIRCHKYPKDEKINLPGEILKRINPLKNKKLLVKGGKLLIEGEKSAAQLKDDERTAKLAKKKRMEEKKKELVPLFIEEPPKEVKQASIPQNVKGKKGKQAEIGKKTETIVIAKKAEPTETVSKQTAEKKDVSVSEPMKKEKEEPSKEMKQEDDKRDLKPKGGWCILFRWF